MLHWEDVEAYYSTLYCTKCDCNDDIDYPLASLAQKKTYLCISKLSKFIAELASVLLHAIVVHDTVSLI